MRVLVVVLLAGCWHDAPPPLAPAPQDTSSSDEPIQRHRRPPLGCRALIPAMEGMFGRSAGFQSAMPTIIDAVVNSCGEDEWSPDLIQCFVSAGDAADERQAQECTRLFSHDQMDNLQKRLMTAMTNNPPQPPGPPSPPDPNAP